MLHVRTYPGAFTCQHVHAALYVSIAMYVPSQVRFNNGSIRCVLTNPQTNTGTTQTIIVAPYAYR